MGLRRDRALHRRRFPARTRALSNGGKDVEPCARSRRAAFRLGHVVVAGSAGRPVRDRTRLCLGRLGGGDGRVGDDLHRRLAAPPTPAPAPPPPRPRAARAWLSGRWRAGGWAGAGACRAAGGFSLARVGARGPPPAGAGGGGAPRTGRGRPRPAPPRVVVV